MDYKQAIKEIVELMGDSNYTDVWSGASNEPMNMALDLAIEALGKQVPKITQETQELMTIDYICPECDCTNARRFNYCWNCGQALINN